MLVCLLSSPLVWMSMGNMNIEYIIEHGNIKVSKESNNEHERRTNDCQYATQ